MKGYKVLYYEDGKYYSYFKILQNNCLSFWKMKPLQYNEKDKTFPEKNNGSICVFKTKEDVQNFLQCEYRHVSIYSENIRIFEIEYDPDDYSKSICNERQITYIRFIYPSSALAFSVTLLEDITPQLKKFLF